MSAFRFNRPLTSAEFEARVRSFTAIRGAVSSYDLIYDPHWKQGPLAWVQAAYRVYEARVQAWKRRRALLRAYSQPQKLGGCGGYVDPFRDRLCTCLWHGGFKHTIEGSTDSDEE